MLDSHRVSTTQHTYNMTTTTDLNLNYANLPINVHPEVTPSSPTENQPTIGLIGMGAMGRMYAKYLGQAGWRRYVSSLSTRFCDAPNLYPQDPRLRRTRKIRKIEGGLCWYVSYQNCSPTHLLTNGKDASNIFPVKDGHAVARSSDFIIYSVEAEFIANVVAQYGPCTSFPSKNIRLSHSSLPNSDQDARDRRWPDIC